MILAELNVRHTRRHMPTRRVALGDHYLPTGGPGYGAVLLGAVAADSAPGLDPEQQDALARFLDDARRDELSVPRIAMRYRLQTDVHGLDRSRHRIVGEDAVGGNGDRPRVVLELDVHGRADPQLIGTVMAAAALPTRDARQIAFRAIEGALARPGVLPEGVVLRRLYEGVPGARPAAPGAGGYGAGPALDPWRSVPAERRWAMEVLGLGAVMTIDRDDVQRRFRRLVRLAHPDHGGVVIGAAERIAELTEARELLLTVLASQTLA
ncbi:MAG: J domain-containing protein [Acidimicrobiia bacterium]